ncbi:MAG: dihydrolipoamide dehydrogenase [Desulfobacterales bacterium SG8_35_2]|nr:MAG: dihydrolipoamide dehydrogenase [Desulfobacterales bacterium SG8_35_2]
MDKKLLQRLLIVAAIVGAVILFKVLDLGQYLSLDYLKTSQGKFLQLYSQNRLAVIAAYMAIYIAVTTLSLPGAAVMTLAGGALFGFWIGFVVVSFASTIGATLACFVARFLLRDWVQKRFGDKLSAINTGIKKEGSFYLFSLRLVPIFPFFIINLAMGLTPMKLFTFYWVSQIGMLPGTMVYVNAGKELGQIESLSGILSPGLIISFVILGLFPITAKKLLALYSRKTGKLLPEEKESTNGKI